MRELFRSGSKSAGVAQVVGGGIGSVITGANAYQSYGAAAKEFGDSGAITDFSNWVTLATHEGQLLWGSLVGKIGLAPKDWWIGQGYNYLTAANFSAIAAAALGTMVIKGFGDFARGVDDIGGRSSGIR